VELTPRPGKRRLLRNRRGMAAVEFALIAPALIVICVGVFEMTLRFSAGNEATRYVHEVADLVARDDTAATSDVSDIYNASAYMMKPVPTSGQLDLDISAIGYKNNANQDPYILWRLYHGTQVPITLTDQAGLGAIGESVILVGVRYYYTSPITSMFGGSSFSIVRTAVARPREVRMITMNGQTDANGATTSF
jgi:hypothetical protein